MLKNLSPKIEPDAAAAPAALPMQTRLAPVSGIDVEKRTVDVVWTTGAAVRRARWTGWDTRVAFDEILLVTKEAVDLSRLQSGAPALDSHSVYSTFSQVGVVDSARLEKGEGLATIRFPSKSVDEAADRMFALVAERIIRNISVGYTINEVRIEEAKKPGEVEKRIVTRWTPFELSFVTVNADPGAQVRAQEGAAMFPIAIARAAHDFSAAAIARMHMRGLMR